MTLKSQIYDDMKSAMKSGDKDRLKVVRLILAAIKQIEIDTRTEVDDPAVLTGRNKMVKTILLNLNDVSHDLKIPVKYIAAFSGYALSIKSGVSDDKHYLSGNLEIEKLFGFRKMNDVTRVQSWCRECRSL